MEGVRSARLERWRSGETCRMHARGGAQCVSRVGGKKGSLVEWEALDRLEAGKMEARIGVLLVMRLVRL
jgi:hypothetical protein